MEGLKINKEQQVVYANKEEAYLISSRDWKRLKAYIKKLKSPTSHWLNIAWGTLGIGLTSFVSWLTCRDNVAFLVIGVLGIGLAIISFFASRSEKEHCSGSVDALIDVFTEIDEVLTPKSEESS